MASQTFGLKHRVANLTYRPLQSFADLDGQFVRLVFRSLEVCFGQILSNQMVRVRVLVSLEPFFGFDQPDKASDFELLIDWARSTVTGCTFFYADLTKSIGFSFRKIAKRKVFGSSCPQGLEPKTKAQ
jgi:hypothetical protein